MVGRLSGFQASFLENLLYTSVCVAYKAENTSGNDLVSYET